LSSFFVRGDHLLQRGMFMRVPSIRSLRAPGCCVIGGLVLLASIARLFASPLCTGYEAEPNPPACGGSYTPCSGYTTPSSCPASPSCIGQYPNRIAQACVAGTDPNVFCTNGQDVICRQIADCHWSATSSPTCVQDEWCQIIYDTPKVTSGSCTPAG
jgi:hypothetical protein